MYLYIHFLTSLVLAAILYPFVGLYSLWILVGGFLIDADHYLWTISKFKWWSLAFAYEYHDDRLNMEYERDILHILHTVEFWIFMILAATICYFFNWTFFFWMFALTFTGMVLHLILDFSDLIYQRRVDVRAISLIAWLRRRSLL